MVWKSAWDFLYLNWFCRRLLGRNVWSVRGINSSFIVFLLQSFDSSTRSTPCCTMDGIWWYARSVDNLSALSIFLTEKYHRVYARLSGQNFWLKYSKYIWYEQRIKLQSQSESYTTLYLLKTSSSSVVRGHKPSRYCSGLFVSNSSHFYVTLGIFYFLRS